MPLMPASPIWISVALLSAILVPAAAQTWTSCNPLNRTDCPADLALEMNHTYDITQSSAGSTWNTTAGNVQYSSESGAAFTVANRGDAPTIQTKFYIFFGEVEVWMKAATGQGIISSIVLESDDLDEVDWEFTGTVRPTTTERETPLLQPRVQSGIPSAIRNRDSTTTQRDGRTKVSSGSSTVLRFAS